MKAQFRFGRVKLNNAGFRAFRTHERSHKLVRESAQRIADAAGPTYEVHEAPSANRARATVYTEDLGARARDNKEQKLLGAIGAAKQ